MPREIFISYSSVNYNEAQRIGKELSVMGISNWLAPNQLIYGPEYSGQITEAIREASILIVLISKDSLKSHQVFNEIALATEYKKEIIAFRLDNEPLTDKFKYYLVARHWIDASTDRITAMTKLTHLVKKIRNNQSEEPKSEKDMENERKLTEYLFMFVRTGVALLTVIAWLIVLFTLHSYAYGTPMYSIGLVVSSLIEMGLIIVIAGPAFGGSGKFTRTFIKYIFDAFRGKP